MALIDKLTTPAYVSDKKVLKRDMEQLRAISDKASCKLLYSPKANALSPVLRQVQHHVDGFACSSAYELRLVDSLFGDHTLLTLVSPMIKRQTLDEIGDRISYLTFNSFSQWSSMRPRVSSTTSVGLRVNPQLSFIRDARYDPCRNNSKLGIRITELAAAMAIDPGLLDGISGVHFHTNCESTDLSSLLSTVRHLKDLAPGLLEHVDWINLGGGYLFDPEDDFEPFFQAVEILRNNFDLTVFIEPGAAAVRRSGIIEAQVHDIFDGDDVKVAVLDTSVNHMPEVFEFQFEPDVLGHVESGMFSYLLSGCTCLAGDVFGEYSFDAPLETGTRVSFLNMGAYTLTKAHRFNGIELPTIYERSTDGSLRKIAGDSFEAFERTAGIVDCATH